MKAISILVISCSQSFYTRVKDGYVKQDNEGLTFLACSSIRITGFSVISFADTHKHACYIGVQPYERSSCEKSP